MEIINFLETSIAFLEKSSLFLALRFLLGFYLIIIFTTIILIGYRLVKFNYLRELMTGVGRVNFRARRDKFQKRCDLISRKLNTGDYGLFNEAIFELADFLNEILGMAGYEGASLGEKLEGMSESQLSDLERIKEASKIKNMLKNNSKFKITRKEASGLLDIFISALKELEAIY